MEAVVEEVAAVAEVEEVAAGAAAVRRPHLRLRRLNPEQQNHRPLNKVAEVAVGEEVDLAAEAVARAFPPVNIQ